MKDCVIRSNDSDCVATSPSISFAVTRAESILGFSCSGFGSEATVITDEVDEHVHTWAVGLFKYEFNELLSLEENDLPSLELCRGEARPIIVKWRSLSSLTMKLT